MRFLRVPAAAAALVAATSCALASAASDEQPPAKAHLYLYPASPSAASSVSVSPADANRVLSYHLDVPGERLGLVLNEGKDRDVWSWMKDAFGQERQAAGDLADMLQDSKHRMVVYVDGIENPENMLVGQNSLQQTHLVSSSPSSQSWNALLSSYIHRIPQAGARSAAAGGLLGSKTLDTLPSAGHDAAENVIKSLTMIELNPSAAIQVFNVELNRFIAVFEKLSHGGMANIEQKPAFQAWRFSSLPALKATYGADSEQYQSAVQAVGAAIKSATEKLKKYASDASQELRMAVIVSSDASSLEVGAEDSVVKKREVQYLLAPFSTASKRQHLLQQDVYHAAASSPASSPYVPRGSAATLTTSTRSPNEADYAGKCFPNKSDLFKATAECSGRGDAVERNFAGRKCYRCVCRVIRTDTSVTYWAGEACQKIDVSSPLILLASTTVVLLLLVAGSITYLFSEGNQKLPGTLASISLPNMKL
ncbi:hypothetical protein K437DRAFT_255377 [Tilletiaria anomala UBC 951]|uniref:Vacuolar sorting protein Vps3844 C-terminal domain-containing protein n=1 Tax=Tilletiaria anomala (strain ATCC 24038 / CBS 436.72 / UBC 951) TaxID=1037660 RepID=A0A066W680_TILAU|nr:uncharacterized protein K437DRAFT_255377 [Tilletiaria anomala UBC 951]KDN49246.1 hypothetical protein K437DRAFT_255377 [Tilletiaria anomala UBC 951]